MIKAGHGYGIFMEAGWLQGGAEKIAKVSPWLSSSVSVGRIFVATLTRSGELRCDFRHLSALEFGSV